jgi:hypothetical protein
MNNWARDAVFYYIFPLGCLKGARAEPIRRPAREPAVRRSELDRLFRRPRSACATSRGLNAEAISGTAATSAC